MTLLLDMPNALSKICCLCKEPLSFSRASAILVSHLPHDTMTSSLPGREHFCQNNLHRMALVLIKTVHDLVFFIVNKKIPSEMEVTPPHKLFILQTSTALIALL